MKPMSLIRSIGVNFKHLFKKPFTVMYPDKKREVPERWRLGGFALTFNPETGEENCIACQLCQNICPSQIITVVRGMETINMPDGTTKKRTFAKEFYIDYQACMQCELCVQVCPTDAIVMVKERKKPGYRREDLIYDKERLLENGRRILRGELEISWSTGNRLRELQDPKRV
jgi:NADH-quinone oxidoreductase subunit I